MLTASLADVYFQAMEERGEREDPLVPRKTTTAWSMAYEILGLWLYTEDMTMAAAEEAEGLATITRKMATRAMICNRLGSTVAGREAAPNGCLSPAMAVLRP